MFVTKMLFLLSHSKMIEKFFVYDYLQLVNRRGKKRDEINTFLLLSLKIIKPCKRMIKDQQTKNR